MKQALEKQYSKITELEERFQHKMHAAEVDENSNQLRMRTPIPNTTEGRAFTT